MRRGGSGDREPPSSGSSPTRLVHRLLPRRAGLRRVVGTTWLAGLVACSVFLVTMMGMPRQQPTAPPGSLVVASLPFWYFRDGTNTVVQHRDAINEVSPWMYGLGEDGRLTTQYPPDQARAVSDTLDRLRDADIPVMPSLANITNGAWSYEPVARVLHDPRLRHRHVEEIVQLVKREDYTGIDLDYENLRAPDRQVFAEFVTELGDALHSADKKLSVAVFAKDSDAGVDERNVAQDYAAIGRAADEVRLMAYDFHWSTSPPGPVAPIEWVRQVLNYAKTQMPPDKIVLGIPLYGYDWSGGQGRGVTWLQVLKASNDHHAQPVFDARSQSPSLRYTDEHGADHEVWFENAASSRAKLDAARGAGVRGVYLWMYGYEDTGVWNEVRNNLPVR